jgi:hypothetical protein
MHKASPVTVLCTQGERKERQQKREKLSEIKGLQLLKMTQGKERRLYYNSL